LEAIMEDPFLLKDTKPKPQQKWSPPPRGPDAVVDLSKVKSFVLDEVDKMFQMGHFPDVKTIFTYLPKPQKGKETNKMQVNCNSNFIKTYCFFLVCYIELFKTEIFLCDR
jgi:hypothetical protein